MVEEEPYTYKFEGPVDSIEYAAKLWHEPNKGGEILLEIFNGEEKVRSCEIKESMSRSRQCCETEFWSHGKEVKFKMTCLKAVGGFFACVKSYEII